jgi:GntR family transcriptional regulator, rspAB operon transcriptional repressor
MEVWQKLCQHNGGSMAQGAGTGAGLDPGQPVAPQVHARVQRRILTGDLPPGARLSESEIAAAYGVSRQPVREAFIKLADEGLLEVRPQRGSYVRRISVQAVLDARFVREAIEADVVRLLATQPAAGLADRLSALVDAQRAALAAGDAAGFVPLDDQFHRTLAEAAGKPFAWAVIEGMKAQMDRVRELSAVRRDRGGLVDQHRAIVAAIAAGDPAAAEAAMRTHLREILRDLPAIRAALPDHFDGDMPEGGGPLPPVR